MKKRMFLVVLTGLILVNTACKKEKESEVNETQTTETVITGDVPAIYKTFYNVEEVSVEGDYILVKTKGIPDHKSPYYKDTDWESSLYEDNTASDFILNPNRITSQNYTFRFPKSPLIDAQHSATPMGPIGVALNGVPFFNQYAAGGSGLDNEIRSFDQYNGHPTGTGAYHYHVEPLHITLNKGKDELLGFLLDGFPVYGAEENGVAVSNSDLDVYHGHVSVTKDYPNGIYHYHITDQDPYINGDGYYGKAGTVTQ